MAKFRYNHRIESFIQQKEFYFEWDEGNHEKSYAKHDVLCGESEEVFFDERILVLGDQVAPKTEEKRFGVIGSTFELKILFVCFTIRGNKIRVISARRANKNERRLYEKS